MDIQAKQSQTSIRREVQVVITSPIKEASNLNASPQSSNADLKFVGTSGKNKGGLIRKAHPFLGRMARRENRASRVQTNKKLSEKVIFSNETPKRNYVAGDNLANGVDITNQGKDGESNP
ncbi:unnamed protein product [Ilex paraguariensis]|uniref:Uncharacterized protein n=1 Tax=Ilex paraguariensis TaxID=185542 RepID=A0ABC8RGA8_9AQUA